MNLSELQGELRRFAAERDWQPFHTPKNLSTALMVEAAELAEVFQWLTPEESRLAYLEPATKQCIADEVADVLLYLLQLADHCEINAEQAVADKLARNAVKYPAKRQIARVPHTSAAAPRTHVLLDYENVQPSDTELRVMVPDAGSLWVFHGPHQREVEQRFASFGADVTAVPISKTGKNALDFHLSFYLGFIASRNPGSTMVVVANDKGYEPILEHANALGFVVRRQSHGEPRPAATKKTAAKHTKANSTAAKKGAAKRVTGKQVPAKKGTVKNATARPAPKKAPSVKAAPGKAAAPKQTTSIAAKAVVAPRSVAATEPVHSPALSPPAHRSTVSAADNQKIAESLRKMGGSRPTKAASLRRLLKSLLAAETGDQSIEVALLNLIASGVAAIGAGSEVKYPAFEPPPHSAPAAT